MEALRLRTLTLAIVLLSACRTEAGSFQTVNFSVTAERQETAEQIGRAAEDYRRQLAIFWLGKSLPNWSRPCKISVREGAIGAGGQTTFQFVRGEVLNWRMQVQGTRERILDSVLPHEINHTIFACHFRRPLPRWADEGAATLFEHRSEQLKQLPLLNEVIRNKREMISLRDLLSMKDYPQGQRPMLTLYAQGYALADFLVQQKGRHTFLKFISDGERGGWEQAIRNNFDHEGIESLEKNWRGWVLAGMPKLTLPRDQMLAANENSADSRLQAAARPEVLPADELLPTRKRQSSGDAVIRSQSPDEKPREPTEHSAGPTSAVFASASEVSTETDNPVRSKISRRASFEAPRPRSIAREDQSESVQNVSATQADSIDIFLDEISTQSNAERSGGVPSLRKFDARDSNSSNSDSPNMEPTAMMIAEDPDESGEDTNDLSGSFQFGGVVLPRERKVTSGGTPQWAGFPGQKKSF